MIWKIRYCCLLGRPARQKGLYDLLVAMDKILVSCPIAKLVVIGNSEEFALKDMMKISSKNAASVIYTGQLDRNMLKEWMGIAVLGSFLLIMSSVLMLGLK